MRVVALTQLPERVQHVLERIDDVLHRGVALFGRLLKAAEQQHLEHRRTPALVAHHRRRRGRLVEVAHDDLRVSLALEHRHPGGHVVQHAAQRVDVGAGSDRVAADLLGRHIVRRAHERRRHGDVAVAAVRVEDLGQAEVQQLHALGLLAVKRGQHHHVGGLEVAVQHIDRVRHPQRARDLQPDPKHALEGQRALHVHHVLQREALEVLHHDVQLAGGELPVIVHGHDVIVAGPRERRRLTHEALAQLHEHRDVAADDLDGDLAIEVDLVGEVDRAHAALAQAREDAVPAIDHRTFGEGCGIRSQIEHRGRRSIQAREGRGNVRNGAHATDCPEMTQRGLMTPYQTGTMAHHAAAQRLAPAPRPSASPTARDVARDVACDVTLARRESRVETSTPARAPRLHSRPA